jgi:hypothetical protein
MPVAPPAARAAIPLQPTAESPYVGALGPRIDELSPRLRAYFGTIPEGWVGRGEGVFTTFGTRHRWLAPVLRVLARRGVVAPGFHEQVRFRIENRTVAGRAVATRRLALPGGEWTMTDAVHLTSRGTVVDVIGAPATVAAEFGIRVAAGALELRSTTIALRWGRLTMRVPRGLAPVVRLRERDAPPTGDGLDSGAQQVELTIDVPLIGRVYEYRGTFAYRIEEDRP